MSRASAFCCSRSHRFSWRGRSSLLENGHELLLLKKGALLQLPFGCPECVEALLDYDPCLVVPWKVLLLLACFEVEYLLVHREWDVAGVMEVAELVLSFTALIFLVQLVKTSLRYGIFRESFQINALSQQKFGHMNSLK